MTRSVKILVRCGVLTALVLVLSVTGGLVRLLLKRLR